MTIAFYKYYNDDTFLSVYDSIKAAADWLGRTAESLKASVSMIKNGKIDNSIYTPLGRAKIFVYKD